MPPLQLFHLSLAAGFSGSSAPFAFGKMLPVAEIGLGSGALGCLVELHLSLVHLIQNSLPALATPADTGGFLFLFPCICH